MPSRETSRRRPNRAQARVGRKNALGIALIGIVLLAVGAGAATVVVFKPPPRDDATACRLDAPPSSLTIVLIDSSDPLADRQRADVKRRLDEARGSVATDGRIELYALTDKPNALLVPIAVACNPGDPKSANPFFASPKIAADRWREVFGDPIDEAIARSLNTAPTKLSPIMEAIQSVAVTALSHSAYQGVERRLFIVSDFIQNVPEANQYNGLVPFEKFSKTPYYRRVRADLRGVKVDMLYLWRTRPADQRVQGRAHGEFWMQFFVDQGAIPTDHAIQG